MGRLTVLTLAGSHYVYAFVRDTSGENLSAANELQKLATEGNLGLEPDTDNLLTCESCSPAGSKSFLA
jgi:hypothetical protein